jgi:hypothetical protein
VSLPTPAPNTYEAPGCQETNHPYERFFLLFSAFFLAPSSLGNVS